MPLNCGGNHPDQYPAEVAEVASDCASPANSYENVKAHGPLGSHSLRDELFKRVHHSYEQQGTMQRALAILEKHPEFEEFLEFQRLVKRLGIHY